MTLGYTLTHAANASAVRAVQLEIVHNALQHIPILDPQDCALCV